MKIFVIGPRTVGKTTIGKLLAKKRKMEFIDFDEYVEQKLKKQGGMKGFAKKHSWPYYWAYANRFLKQVMMKKSFVCALGGTVFGQPDKKYKKNAETIKKTTIVALYPKNQKMLAEREKQRKYWKEHHLKRMKSIVKRDYTSIKPTMDKYATIKIKTQNKTPNEITKEIISKLK